MTLTGSGRDYIAEKIGTGNCWVYSGLSWVAVSVLGDRVDRTGGTGKAVNDIISPTTDHIEIGGLNISKTTLRNNNGGSDVTVADVTGEILLNDGYPAGENQYCKGVTPPPIEAALYLATDPYCCSAWIDADPAVDPATIACTKDKTIGEFDTIELDGSVNHTLHIRKTGHEDYYNELAANAYPWAEFVYLKPLAGTNVALLTVNAYKEEEKPSKVPVDNAVLKKGTSKMGFCPYSDSWRADVAGSRYSISVVAEGRATHEESIVLYKDTPKTIDAYLPEKKLEVVIKIAPGVAYIDDISGGDYQVWYIGTRIEGWVRVETFMDKPTMFKAELTFCTKGTTTPVAGISKIITEEKLLHPSMSASDRHLDWPSWLVPDKPGEYSLVAELFMMT